MRIVIIMSGPDTRIWGLRGNCCDGYGGDLTKQAENLIHDDRLEQGLILTILDRALKED